MQFTREGGTACCNQERQRKMLPGQCERVHQTRSGEQIQGGRIQRIAVPEKQRRQHGLPLRHEAAGARLIPVFFVCRGWQGRRFAKVAHKGAS